MYALMQSLVVQWFPGIILNVITVFNPDIDEGALAERSWKIAPRPSWSFTASPRNTTLALMRHSSGFFSKPLMDTIVISEAR